MAGLCNPVLVRLCFVFVCSCVIFSPGGSTSEYTQQYQQEDVPVIHYEPEESQRHSRRRDLSGERLRVATILEPPFMMLKAHSGRYIESSQRFEGFLAALMSRIAWGMGVRYDLLLVPDRKYGSLNETGQWDGAIGKVVNGEADLALGPITITDQRLEAIDFSMPYLKFSSTAVIRKPTTMHNIRDVLASNYHYGTVQGSATDAFLQNASQHRDIWPRIHNFFPNGFVHNIEEGRDSAINRKYAFITDYPRAQYMTSREPCLLYSIEPFLDVQEYGIVMAKGSRHKAKINRQLSDMRDSGYIAEQFNLWWTDECSSSHRDDHSTIAQDHRHHQSRTQGGGRARGGAPVPKSAEQDSRESRNRQNKHSSSQQSSAISSATTTRPVNPWRQATAVSYTAAGSKTAHMLCNCVTTVLLSCAVAVLW